VRGGIVGEVKDQGMLAIFNPQVNISNPLADNKNSLGFFVAVRI
jgi:hypothetical protein